MVNDRLKHVVATASNVPARFVQKLYYKKDSTDPELVSYYHNPYFMTKAFDLFKIMGQKNRYKLFARIRYQYDIADDFLSTKSNSISLYDKETQKSAFFNLLINKKVFMMACIAFSARVCFPMHARQFKDTYMELKQINQIQTHNLFENLQRFKE